MKSKQSFDKRVETIVGIIQATSIEDRGVLLYTVASELRESGQHYTAELIMKASSEYKWDEK